MHPSILRFYDFNLAFSSFLVLLTHPMSFPHERDPMNVTKSARLYSLKKENISNCTQKTAEDNVTHNYILFTTLHFEHHLFEVVQDIAGP